jgi:hypothetical protein
MLPSPFAFPPGSWADEAFAGARACYAAPRLEMALSEGTAPAVARWIVQQP